MATHHVASFARTAEAAMRKAEREQRAWWRRIGKRPPVVRALNATPLRTMRGGWSVEIEETRKGTEK